MEQMILKNRFLEVELAAPSGEGGGNRFCGGTWIRNIKHIGSGHRYFVEKSLFQDTPVFGCPQEFHATLPLAQPAGNEEEYLKIGVGRLLHRKGHSRFQDLVRERFPWRCSLGDHAALFAQKVDEIGGYAYVLEQRVSIQGTSVSIGNVLRNTGSKSLETEVHIHPFFDECQQDGTYWYQIPCQRSGVSLVCGLSDFPLNNEVVPEDELCSVFNWVATGERSGEKILGICSDVPFSKINPWREPGHCYAIEPHISFRLEPGEQQRWNWWLVAGQGSDRVLGVKSVGLGSGAKELLLG